jgi:ABC-type multidrug transport system ATPase subunit
MLDFTCLEDFTKQRSHHFSGGMGEKLLLDCALIQEPRVLLLVELTPGIDSVARRELWHILFQVILNGVTVPVSTPYMDEVERGNQGNILNEVKVLSTCASRESEDEFPFDFLEVKARPRRAIREVIGAKVDDALLQAQREQSAAAVHMSEAALDATLVQQESTQIQDDLALQAVQQQDQQNRVNTGQAEIPEQLNLPVWYFEKDDELTAAEKAVAEAEAALESELANLNAVRFSASNADFVAVEERFVEAHPEVAVARHVLDRAEQAQDSEPLRGQAQKQLDAARAELNAVQEAFNPMLTSAASQDVLEVRARVTNAKARYGAAFDGLNVLQTGENSLQVKAAQTGLAQAEAAVSQVCPFYTSDAADA